jgi:hypothetical protein
LVMLVVMKTLPRIPQDAVSTGLSAR